MMIKTILISLTTAILTVGCVAFPDDGPYHNTAYGNSRYYNVNHDSRDYNRYQQNNERLRWERERAYRIQQVRADQQRKQNLDRQRWQFEQNRKRIEIEKQRRIDFNRKQHAPTWQQSQKDRDRWNRNNGGRLENQHKRPPSRADHYKRDDKRSHDRDKD